MIHVLRFEASRAKFDRRISLETHDRQRVGPTGRAEMGRSVPISRSPQADEETMKFGFFQAWLGRSMVAPSKCLKRQLQEKKPRRRVVSRAGASSTRPRPGYPSSGCSAAEPDSDSPGKSDYSSAAPACGQIVPKPAKRAHRVCAGATRTKGLQRCPQRRYKPLLAIDSQARQKWNRNKRTPA